MDTFFITYNEPLKESRWQSIQRQIPNAQWIDGIKGFNKAHKACAAQAQSHRFFTIDGDNQLSTPFAQLTLPSDLIDTDYVFSWSSRNSVNGLAYGNGGIKNWPTHIFNELKSHEEAQCIEAAVDFCFQLKYYQMPETPSVTVIHTTPEQAFRSGFREGVKMSLDKGHKIETSPSQLPDVFHRRIHEANLERLRIWCSVGADVENGLWAIYGARLGCSLLYQNKIDLKVIRDYDWFHQFWKEHISSTVVEKQDLLQAIEDTGQALEKLFDLKVMLMDPHASRFFKSVYVNRPRQGLMFQ